jgi:hypothetical protein
MPLLTEIALRLPVAMMLGKAVYSCKLSCAEAPIHHKSVGLTGGQRDLSMINYGLQVLVPNRLRCETQVGEFNRAE